jgi:hypothetical protein
MANPEHLEILKQGVGVWNTWRTEHKDVLPDFGGADLRGSDLSGADLRDASLSDADLRGANLSGADLDSADLSEADLRDADLRNANLFVADLSGADLSGADFTDVTLAYTTFVDNDLSAVKGLEKAHHETSSGAGIDTIYKSQGNIPEIFLRGCGVPESFIVQMRSLVASTEAIQFYSCFISYSSKDQEFAERLHADLQAKGVRVWFAPHDMKIGARIRPTIDESIRIYDKLLLVLSEASVSSQWVEQEVETALRKERQSGGTVLFPVRLDDTVFEAGEGWPALVKDTRHVGDFTRWKEHDSYREAFDRLLRDLKAEA